MNKTKIPWATHTWNPIRGCTKISAGCENCYAEKMAKRFYKGQETIPPNQYFKPTMLPDRLDEPLRWKKPRKIFVCSMGDLFHEDVPDEFIYDVWHKMALAHQHTFMILTKRPERINGIFNSWICNSPGHPGLNLATGIGATMAGYSWPPTNVWLGVTCENQAMADERIPILLQIPAAVRFVSCEPLLKDINLNHYLYSWGDPFNEGRMTNSVTLNWVIVGGETGPGARECREEWVQSVYDQCVNAKVPFFFKNKGRRWVSRCDGVICSHCMAASADDHCEIDWEQRREWPK